MREDIKSLKICGGKFAEEASLAFWGNTTQANKKNSLRSFIWQKWLW